MLVLINDNNKCRYISLYSLLCSLQDSFHLIIIDKFGGDMGKYFGRGVKWKFLGSCAFITDTIVFFNDIVDQFEEKVCLNIIAKLCSYT